MNHRERTGMARVVPSSVKATAENVWISLGGNMKWAFERNAAVDSVNFLSGVKGVTNHITIKPEVKLTAVKESIEKALKRDADIDAKNINVLADGTKVTLSGKIRSWDEREEAGAAAWYTPGVMHVTNDLVTADQSYQATIIWVVPAKRSLCRQTYFLIIENCEFHWLFPM